MMCRGNASCGPLGRMGGGRHPRPGGSVLFRQADQFLIGGDTYQTGEPHSGHAKGKTDGAGRADMVEGTIPLMFKA